MVDISKLTQVAREAEGLAPRYQGALEAVQRLTPTLRAISGLQEGLGLGRILEDVNRQSALMRAAMEPLEELRLSGALGRASELSEQLFSAGKLLEGFNARFTLPDFESNLRKQLDLVLPSGVLAGYSLQATDVQRAIEAMRTPWLDAQNPLRSIAAFAELQGIGNMLSQMPSFDDMVSRALRADLGDWRDKVTWTEPVLTDLGARSEFYVSLGFNPFLTDLPAEAFQESTDIAGLSREPPHLVDLYGEPVSRAADLDEEVAFNRTNKAHDWLQRLETNLRRFIDDRMTVEFGHDWPRHRLPSGCRERWEEKRSAAIKAGRSPKALISYADFTDYERIICRSDNWKQVFAHYFGRAEDIRESFQRLHPIRLDTMHARPIGQDDELLLYVEVKRLIGAIYK